MSLELLEKVSAELEINNIPYIIIGGQAVLVYGRPRLTNDIDIVLGVDISEFRKVENICIKLGFKVLSEDVEKFVKKTMVFPALDPISSFRIDFIFSFTEFEISAIKRAKFVKILNRKVKFATLEDIIIFKIFASRAQDLEDVKNMLLMNSEIDREYVMKWLQEFDRDPELELEKKFRLIESEIK